MFRAVVSINSKVLGLPFQHGKKFWRYPVVISSSQQTVITVRTFLCCKKAKLFSILNVHGLSVLEFTLLSKNMSTLETLNFDNLALKVLPVDEDKRNCIRQVEGACFSLVEPTPVLNPKTVTYSAKAMSLLDLPETELQRSEFAEYFSGNKILPGARPAAHCYCGHQFGYFSGQLGDGAAMYLGEVLNKNGERWEIQFKGAGLTPYSRTADGRKVLRSSIREFLCSEAMYNLGIPTTRAGSCVTSDTAVIRDIFYDGNPVKEKASIILRIAPTFIRFGSFEIFKPTDKMTGRKGPSVGQKDILEKMLDYTIKTFFPQVYEAHPDNAEDRYLAFYKQVVCRTAALVAEWQCVGFCHGVLNTDNMSILGLTIDYGPFGFMDAFDPDHVCNGSDDQGRYSYKKQPEICRWNLFKFAEAIRDALPIERSKVALEELYDTEYKVCYMKKMRKKLGLLKQELPEDEDVVESLLETMHQTGSDFTNTFRSLHKISIPGSTTEAAEGSSVDSVVDFILHQCQTVEDLKKATKPQMDIRQYQMLMMLLQSNPALAQQLGVDMTTLQQEVAKREMAKTLKDLTPDAKMDKDRELWTAWITKYRLRISQEVQGQDQCDTEAVNKERIRVMKASNPRFILRNYIAQNAILLAEKGDYSEVWKVLKLLENPYSDDVNIDIDVRQLREVETESGEHLSVPQTSKSVSLSCSHDGVPFDSKPPSWTLDIKVT